MPNVASIIKTHNNKVLRQSKPDDPATQQRLCNCRTPSRCPLSGNCLATEIVYKATVKAAGSNDGMHYYGATEGTFKPRYANPQTSFRHERYANATELSKHEDRI